MFVAPGGRPPDPRQAGEHLHHGDEILRILSGEAVVQVGDEQRVCGPGDVVIIPADVVLDAGQVFPVTGEDGTTELVEVYRADMPWSRPPPAGFTWTPDERMAEIVDRAPPLP